MPVPHVCGWPDATNTGARASACPLGFAAVSGTVHLAAGGQLSCKNITGDISVEGNNVTVHDIKLTQTNPDYGVRVFNRAGVTLSYIEINQNHLFNGKAIAFDGYAMDHANIHNGSDCAHLGDNASVVDSFCSLGPDSGGTSWCNGPHVDGFQTDGGDHQTYRHNTIRNPCGQTSAIIIDTDLGATHDVHIVDNLMAGGGYVVYCNGRNQSPSPVVEFSGNRIAKTYFPQGGSQSGGPFVNCPAGGAVWDETGQPIS